MNCFRGLKSLFTLLSLALLVGAAFFAWSQSNSAVPIQPTPDSGPSLLYLPMATGSLPRVPGFVPPDFGSSPFEVPVSLPDCDGQALIVDASTNLNQIDWGAQDVVCLLPGDYTAWGVLLIEDVSGSAAAPKVLRYYDPGDPASPHPVVRADNAGPEAVILQFRLVNGDFWILDGLTIRNSPDDNRATDASHNIFNRLLIEGGDGHLLRLDRDSDDNVVQNSVLRNQSEIALQNDDVCLILYTQDWDHVGLEIENTRIVNNEVYNCNDGIALTRVPDDRPAYYPGTIIANNDIYITDELYTDCLGSRHPDGACGCAENGVDIKATIKEQDVGNPDKWVRFINNRLWGFRNTDDTRNGQGNRLCGSGSRAEAMRIHRDARSLVVQGNVVMDSSHGISGGGAMDSDPPVTGHYLVNNLLYNIHDCFDPGKQGLGQFHLLNEGAFLGCFDENNAPTEDRAKGLATTADGDIPDHYGNTHFGNTVIDVGDNDNQDGWWAFISDANHAYLCNAVLASAGREFASHTTNAADKNAYYDTVPYCPASAPCATQHIVIAPAPAAAHTAFTFSRRPWTGPEQVAIPDALPTSDTPRFGPGGVCWIDDPTHPWN